MLQLNQLCTGYTGKPVCRNLCGTLLPGRLTALLGPNGAGKSTLLRTLAGFIQPLKAPVAPSTPPVTLRGKDLQLYTPRELARAIGVVLTSRPEAEALTAQEVVEMGRIPYTHMLAGQTAADRAAVARAMEQTDTARFGQRPIHTLSDGERQRVFIAKALAQATPVILLDEPTAFLDFPSKVEVLRLLHRLAHEEGKAVLLSTHDVELALQFADTLWLLEAEAIRSGTPAQLADQGEVERFFGNESLHFDSRSLRFVYRAEGPHRP